MLTLWCALTEWISCKARGTSTDGAVVLCGTLSTNATSVRAWISTFEIHTGSILRTLGADYALRSALWRRPNIVLQACAHSLLVYHTALAIGTTR